MSKTFALVAADETLAQNMNRWHRQLRHSIAEISQSGAILFFVGESAPASVLGVPIGDKEPVTVERMRVRFQGTLLRRIDQILKQELLSDFGGDQELAKFLDDNEGKFITYVTFE